MPWYVRRTEAAAAPPGARVLCDFLPGQPREKVFCAPRVAEPEIETDALKLAMLHASNDGQWSCAPGASQSIYKLLARVTVIEFKLDGPGNLRKLLFRHAR